MTKKEEEIALREQSFHMLEAICPSSLVQLGYNEQTIVSQYLFHSNLLYARPTVIDQRPAQFGGLHEVFKGRLLAYTVN